ELQGAVRAGDDDAGAAADHGPGHDRREWIAGERRERRLHGAHLLKLGEGVVTRAHDNGRLAGRDGAASADLLGLVVGVEAPGDGRGDALLLDQVVAELLRAAPGLDPKVLDLVVAGVDRQRGGATEGLHRIGV